MRRITLVTWLVHHGAPPGLNEDLAELGEVGLKSGIRNIGGSIATGGPAARNQPVSDALIAFTLTP